MDINQKNYERIEKEFIPLIKEMFGEKRQSIWPVHWELDALKRTTQKYQESGGERDFDEILKRELGAISNNEKKYSPGFFLKLTAIITKIELENRHNIKLLENPKEKHFQGSLD